jgi:hypothetical protein
MPNFDALSILKWIHFICVAVGGGGIVMALLISGFEDTREDLRGLAATLWSKVVRWPFRLAVLLGIVIIGWMQAKLRVNPFLQNYLWIKLVLVVALLAMSEMGPKALAVGKRGAALLAMLLFLFTSFVVYNRAAFGFRIPTGPAATVTQAQ